MDYLLYQSFKKIFAGPSSIKFSKLISGIKVNFIPILSK
jgi:hypothetical protein